MSRLRVLMISGEYPPMEGGVADFTAILSRAMAAWRSDRHPTPDAEVHVLTSRGPVPGQGRAATASNDIVVEDRVMVHRRMEAWSWLPLRRAVSKLLADYDIDVVNIQYQTAAYGMHPAINLLPLMQRRMPMVVTFHDLLVPYLLPKAGALREWVNLTLARRCRAAIVTNAQDYRRLAAVRGIPRLERIPIGSNISTALPPDYDRAAWRQRWGLPDESVVLCYFGFLNASKGGEDLIRALRRLVDGGVAIRSPSNAMDARLLMIGGAVGASDPTNRAYLARVHALIAELGLEERVIWTGHLPDAEVSACFAIADVCLLPYRDGASFRRGSLMAALAHGMPIVSTYPPTEMLGDEIPKDAVWLVPPSDPAALADAIRSLMRDDDLRRRLGAGAQALSAAFGWDQIAERTLCLLAEVAHG